MMNLDQIRKNLDPVFRHYGVRRALIFGSVARGDNTDRSDVDLYVDSGLKGMRFIGLIVEIKNALGNRDVDVLDVSHVESGSKVDREISMTGVVIYEG